MKLYTLDNQFIKEAYNIPVDFTGIVSYFDGSNDWYCKGKRHREDGPSIEFANGDKEWFINDMYHRLDGPAVEYINGRKEWYFNDKKITEEQHKLLVDIMKLKGLT